MAITSHEKLGLPDVTHRKLSGQFPFLSSALLALAGALVGAATVIFLAGPELWLAGSGAGAGLVLGTGVLLRLGR